MKNVIMPLLILVVGIAFGQTFYTAEGYFRETRNRSYVQLKDNLSKGDSLTADQQMYLADYEKYLEGYYAKLPDAEKQRYEELKNKWEAEQDMPQVSDDFEWRTRDRILNGFYGMYYGTALAALLEPEGGAAAGLPLITAGVMQLGPVINPRKYEGISQTTIRASNSGKFLGLLYGVGLGMVASGGDDASKPILALSSIGSIALGEAAFQWQKKHSIEEGRVEMMRHYGLLAPFVGLCVVGATQTDSRELAGVSIVAGGFAGLAIGNRSFNKYKYTAGDVRYVSSLSAISAGLGLSLAINTLENNDGTSAIILIPALGGVAGSIFAQRGVRGVELTHRQGSTISLATSGTALLGLGLMTFTDIDSPSLVVAIPSLLALVVQQSLFSSYKKQNVLKGVSGSLGRKKRSDWALRVMPENYLAGRQLGAAAAANPMLGIQAPLVDFKIKFK